VADDAAPLPLGARPAEALTCTRVHPEVVAELVVDPAASDRHPATSASVAVGSLHANKTGPWCEI
jgi:hypothetical protein